MDDESRTAHVPARRDAHRHALGPRHRQTPQERRIESRDPRALTTPSDRCDAAEPVPHLHAGIDEDTPEQTAYVRAVEVAPTQPCSESLVRGERERAEPVQGSTSTSCHALARRARSGRGERGGGSGGHTSSVTISRRPPRKLSTAHEDADKTGSQGESPNVGSFAANTTPFGCKTPKVGDSSPDPIPGAVVVPRHPVPQVTSMAVNVRFSNR